MAEDIGVLDGELPLIRGDNEWTQAVALWDDDTKETPHDLTGKGVLAEMRWKGGKQAVTVSVDNPPSGHFMLSLTRDETLNMPMGRLVVLFVQVRDGDELVTWFRAAIAVKEGLSSFPFEQIELGGGGGDQLGAGNGDVIGGGET